MSDFLSLKKGEVKMKNKTFIALSLTSVATIVASCAFILSSNKVAVSKASGENRTLVMDKDTEVTINAGVGVASLERNLKAYSPNCEQLDNGFLRLNTGELIIYYDEVGSGSYHGFGEASISSVVATVKANNELIYAKWATLRSDYSEYLIYGGTSTGISTELTDDEQVLNFNSGNFIDGQATAKGSMYYCIAINSLGNKAFDLISLTVNYTCA